MYDPPPPVPKREQLRTQPRGASLAASWGAAAAPAASRGAPSSLATSIRAAASPAASSSLVLLPKKHCAKCTVNNAQMCTKEILVQEPRHRISMFCALVHVQRAL